MIPIFDTTLVTALRLLSGRRATQGGRDHTSHRLVAVGLSEPRAVATLWLLAAAGGTIAVVLRRDPGWATTAALAFLLAMIIFGVYLARIRVYDDADLARLKEGTVTPLVTTFMYKRRVAEVLLDLCLIPLAYYSAYRLRFEGALLAANYQLFLQSLPVLLSTQLLALFIVGGYRGTWRYFGMMDAVVFAKAVLIGTVAAQTVILYAYRFESYSRTVFVIYAVLFLLLLIGTRASFRLVGEFVHRRRVAGQRCVVYGTGGASITTIRDAFGGVALKIIGFVDDDPRHRNSRISGYQVIGDYSNLLALIEHGEVDCVVMNTHLVDVRRQRELESICRELDVDLLKLHIYLKPVSTAS
jgi:UDP-GlcNAc:undecaprenyl-phosphate GlcNAc-1-phosphate transferase